MVKFELVKKCSSVEKIFNLVNEQFSFSVNTDSRTIKSDDGFISLKGERFDAFQFIPSVCLNNPKLIVFNSEKEKEALALLNQYPNIVWVMVKDTLSFIQELANQSIQNFQKQTGTKTICISGSNGKTTHKEMLYHLINSVAPGKVTCTLKNNNNHLGVPLTIFQISNETEFAIIELGSNHPGEIKTLCDICQPQAGVVTNIGATHLEFFGTEENVFLEEGFLYHAIKSHTLGKGLFIQNTFDPFLKTLEKTQGTLSVGDSSADAVFKFYADAVEIKFKDQTYQLKNSNLLGEHNFHNLAVTFLMALNFFPQKAEELILAASNFKPKDLRSMWIEHHGKKIFLDAYNANPSSMKISLQGFFQYCEQKQIDLAKVYFVLADMNELGNNGQEYHREIGLYLAEKKVKNIAFIGKFNQFYQQGFQGNSDLFSSSLEFKQKAWPQTQNSYDFFFFKGSRSLQLETILDIKDH